jgi:uncharacterized protein with PIN domain
MNWEQRLCTDRACTAQVWMVRRDPAVNDCWWVAAHVDDRPFTVAATEAVCPRCGTPLCSMEAQAHWIGDRILESGKVLEFVRSLPR